MRKKHLFRFAFLLALAWISVPSAQAAVKLELVSPAFNEGEAIPSQFTCEGPNRSPALHWSEPPQGTQSFVLIMEDPDVSSKTWVHWVLYDLPVTVRNLPEGIPGLMQLANGELQGINSARKTGYYGPCPSSGTHRYFFRIYALDTVLNLDPPAAGKEELMAAMKGHILARGQLMGRYSRSLLAKPRRG